MSEARVANALTGAVPTAPIRPVQGPGRFGPVGNPIGPIGLRPPVNPLVTPAAGPRPFPANPIPAGQVDGPRASEGLLDRVSTRIPTSKRLAIDPHATSDISIGSHAMIPEGFHSLHYEPEHHAAAQQAIGDAMAKNANHVREHYPFIDTEGLTDHGVHERVVEHMHDNLVHLWQAVRDRPWVPKAASWYWGANRTAKEMAALHGGITPRQAAAAIAALSPQKDWDQNVSLAERVIHSHRDHQNTPVSQEMRDLMQSYVDKRKPSTRADLDRFVSGGTNKKTGEVYQPIEVGQTLSQLSHPIQRALFVRAYDEAHRPDRGYHIISPYGERQRAKVASTGADATAVWGGFGEIANALKALESQDHLPTISRALGAKHKVRNFYNNIISPDAAAFLPFSYHDVTADTHAINANLLMPLGGSHPKVSEGLGAQGPAWTGAQGLYGLHADAIRRAAQTISAQEGRRYLPREIQSVTWEAIRHMFQKEHKKIEKGTHRPLHPVGQVAEGAAYAARHGFMPPRMARDAIIQAAGGVRDPRWHSGQNTVEEEDEPLEETE